MMTTVIAVCLLSSVPSAAAEPESPEQAAEATTSGAAAGTRDAERSWRPARIGVEVVLGGLLGTAGFLGGMLAADGLVSTGEPPLLALIAAAGPPILGSSLGAWLGGMLMNGSGSYWAALAGAVVGLGIGYPIAALSQSPWGYLLPLSLPVVGAVLGYELSHHLRGKGTTATVAPLLVPSGGGVALMGRF